MATKVGNGEAITSLKEHEGAWRTPGAAVVSFVYEGSKTMTMVKIVNKTMLTFEAGGQAASLELNNP